MAKSTVSSTQVGTAPVGGTVQIGSILPYYGTTAPDTWLLCDGDPIPSKYTQLIAMIGANTPNLSGRVLMGSGTGTDENDYSETAGFGTYGGEYVHTLAMTEMPSHQHFGWGEVTNPNPWGTGQSSNTGYKGSGDSDTDNYLYGSTFTGGNVNDSVTTSNGSATGIKQGTTNAHNNVQPYFAINFIIYAGDADDEDA